MKTKAELLIETLTKGGRKVFTVEETKQLQEISFLEGNYLLDEWDDGKNELEEKINKFKSQFVLTEEEWNTGVIIEEEEAEEEEEIEKRNPSIPRRTYMPEWCEAEKAIYAAIQEVEKMGADERLTYAVDKLSEAKESVADYIDGVTIGAYTKDPNTL